jgi:D-alanine-D-alanine ligase
MSPKVAIIYNEPTGDLSPPTPESESVVGVLEEVVAVHKGLLEAGYEVQRVPLRLPLQSVPAAIQAIQADVIFNLFEGFENDPQSEPVVANIMEEMGIKFTGNSSHTLSLTLDKANFKQLLKKSGVKTPDFAVLTSSTLDEFNLNFPCIVKPRDEDASNGLTVDNVVNDMQQLKTMVERICGRFRGSALVEEFIGGREFNASVLGNENLSLVEISEITYSLPPGLPHILTFESKWFEETDYYKGTGVCCPAKINDDLRAEITQTVLKSCKAAGCRGYARADMRQDRDGTIKVLEVNANPDVTPELGIALQASTRGMSYSQLMKKIVELALE